MTSKFVAFGCWNEFCCDKSSPMYQVLDSISRDQRDAENYFILGDNIYPKKVINEETGEKEKSVDKGQLRNGFSLLKNLLITNENEDSKLYLLLGNHDIEEMEKTGCDTLINERINSMDVSLRRRFIFPEHLAMFQEINDNTLVIMIDTNIYSEDDLDCYSSLGYGSENIKLELQKKQSTEIANKLEPTNNKYKNIIICGHHPLIGFKNHTVSNKKGKLGIKGGVDVCESPLYSLLLDVIKPNSSHDDPNFFYLCADIHNYQEGIVSIIRNEDEMVLEQHIVGIGGAHSDDDYNGKYIDKDEKKQILKENYSQKDIQDRLDEVEVDYNRPAIIDVEDNIELEYVLISHFSDYGYLVGQINKYGNVDLRAVNLGIKASQAYEADIESYHPISGGKRTKRRNKRTRRRNKRTRRRNKRTKRR
jgi:hypothetical protein